MATSHVDAKAAAPVKVYLQRDWLVEADSEMCGSPRLSTFNSYRRAFEDQLERETFEEALNNTR